MPELIDLTIPPADVAAIQTLLTSLEAAMPFLVGLSADQVKALFKLGPRGEAFVMKALIAAELHPRLLPRKSPLAAMQRNAALRETLRPIRTRVATLLELLDGTMMLAGADLMKNASVVYRVMKISGQGQGVEDLVEDLGQRFTKRRKPARVEEPFTPLLTVPPPAEKLGASQRVQEQTPPAVTSPLRQGETQHAGGVLRVEAEPSLDDKAGQDNVRSCTLSPILPRGRISPPPWTGCARITPP